MMPFQNATVLLSSLRAHHLLGSQERAEPCFEPYLDILDLGEGFTLVSLVRGVVSRSLHNVLELIECRNAFLVKVKEGRR